MKILGKVNYKNLTIVYIISILFLYCIQVIVYGMAITTLVSNLAIVILLVPIGSIYTSRRLTDKDANGNIKSKYEKFIDKYKLLFLAILFFCFSIYGIFNNSYYLASYQLFVISIIMIIWEVRTKKKDFKFREVKEEAIFGILCLILVDITAFSYLLIVDPLTVNQASKNLELAGFESVKYQEIVDNSNVDSKLGYYSFIVSKSTNEYEVLIDVVSGEILQ